MKNSTAAKQDSNRFTRLRLFANRLEATQKFYEQGLGFETVSDSADSVTVSAGKTQIEFVLSERTLPPVLYHFAFNISENKIELALDWIKNRVEVLTLPNRQRQIVHFKNWDAHSIYFYDPSGNLVEFIAHHSLDTSRNGKFETDDILYASEIGLVVDDVAATSEELRRKLDIDCFPCFLETPNAIASKFFRAVGDPRGLFILVQKERNWLMTDVPAIPYLVEITLSQPVTEELRLDSAPCTIKVS